MWEEVNNKISARKIFGIGAGTAIGQSFDAAENKNNYYYINSGHGDVVALVDRNGNIINDYEYDIYGESLKASYQKIKMGT